MRLNNIHGFNLNPTEMHHIQDSLRIGVVYSPLLKEPDILSGFDVSYGREYAVAVLATFNSKLEILELVSHVAKPTFEYVPGLLSFRELPFFLELWKKATVEPDMVMFDGNGVMHERRMGEATHASFFIGKPTIGVAKTYYTGDFAEVGSKVGNYELIKESGIVIGAAVRTMKKANPLFVSVGNFITLSECINLVLRYPARHSKLCEITRYADFYSRKLLSNYNL
jgi:deoxyribonuclease V